MPGRVHDRWKRLDGGNALKQNRPPERSVVPGFGFTAFKRHQRTVRQNLVNVDGRARLVQLHKADPRRVQDPAAMWRSDGLARDDTHTTAFGEPVQRRTG